MQAVTLPPDARSELAARRHRARRTAGVLGLIAAAIFIAFILRGVLLS